MRLMIKNLVVLAFVIGVNACAEPPNTDAPKASAKLTAPAGFQVEVLIDNLPNARSMAWGDEGTLFIGTRSGGKVFAVKGAMSDSPQTFVIADGLKVPNGVAVRDGTLYVAETQRILTFPDIESRLDNPGEPEVLVDDLPYKTPLHAWKYLAFGPDGRLYVPVGAPCNACQEPGFAMIMSMLPDGTDRRIEAEGVRNSVGFDWHPMTGELWFTDNGRDMLGDDLPACELNRMTAQAQDFGFPYCHGGDVQDPEFGSLGQCEDAQAPVLQLDPHSAPLGMLFYNGEMFPERYRGQIFLAEHGSWNRSKAAGKTGYRVALVSLDGDKAKSYDSFLTGFLEADEVVGRPVDLIMAPDGSLLVSDDKRGLVLRVSYSADDA
ncbi:MAG: PQQ-dependent sugar dehydrogenase [Gammaproteobacteria bacterium]